MDSNEFENGNGDIDWADVDMEEIHSPDGEWSMDKEQVKKGTNHLLGHHIDQFNSFPVGSEARVILLGHSMANAMGMSNEAGERLILTNPYFASMVRKMVPMFELILDVMAIRDGGL